MVLWLPMFQGEGKLCAMLTLDTDEVLDVLLDQEGLEIDNLDRMEKDTPLHKAVRFVNNLDKEEWEAGHQVAEILIDAGCDPRSVGNSSDSAHPWFLRILDLDLCNC